MKKFLFVLLIAFIVAEENDSMAEKLVRFLETLPDILRKLYNWIFKNNYWVEFIVKRIKQQLKGEWLVFASTINLKGFDFSLSIVTGNDFLCFTIKGFRFQVCRLRD